MNTVILSSVTYSPAPENFRGVYYKKKTVGQFEAKGETLEEIEGEIYARRSEFPPANWFLVTDEQHPAGWVSGTV